MLPWHWSPNNGWSMNHEIRGWNECLITYVLAAGAPPLAAPRTVLTDALTPSRRVAFARLPLDTIKIDRPYVSAMGTDSAASALVQTIVAIGHGLNLHLVAEGVETRSQSRVLADLGCHQLQGRLSSDVVDADGVRALVAAAPRFTVNGLSRAV